MIFTILRQAEQAHFDSRFLHALNALVFSFCPNVSQCAVPTLAFHLIYFLAPLFLTALPADAADQVYVNEVFDWQKESVGGILQLQPR